MENTKRFILSVFATLVALSFVFGGILFVRPSLAANSFLEKQVGVGSDEMAETFGESNSTTASDLRVVIARYIKIFLGFLGIIFLCLILYGGFLWMTDTGNSDNVKKAKSILATGIIGLIVIVSSFAIADFIMDSVVEATIVTPSAN